MCIKCGNKYHIVMAGQNDLEPELKRIAKLIYSGKMKSGDIDPAMIRKISRFLMSGVFEGYGKSFADSLTIEEFGTLKALEQNVFVFSGFKNYQQLKETTLLLKDDNGQIKSFNQFLKDVRTVNSTYNEVYLSAEYSNAVASSQAIAFWEESERNKEHVKNLRWRTAGDSRVRPKHAALDGLTLPKDHDFWKITFIPLDWGCRCDIEETNDEPTDIPEILPKVPKMFQNNVGISGIIFPETHPYFDVDKKGAAQINNVVSNEINKAEYDELAKDYDWDRALYRVTNENIKKTFPALDNEELATINDYTYESYYDLNKALRQDRASGLLLTKEKVLNRALDKMPNAKEDLVFRSTVLGPRELQPYLDALKTKKPIIEKSFISTSKNRLVAEDFVTSTDKTVFHILHKNGKDLGDASFFSAPFGNGSEEEVLFKSKTKFLVRDVVTNSEGVTEIYMEETI